jgi:hypothetical protein
MDPGTLLHFNVVACLLALAAATAIGIAIGR